MRIALLGLPGAGKGTQAAKIADGYGVPAVGMGDLLRGNDDAVIHYDDDEKENRDLYRVGGSPIRADDPEAFPGQVEIEGTRVETLGQRLNAGEGPSTETSVYFLAEKLTSDEAADGYVLDGFPRWGEQAAAMDDIDDLDAIVYLDVSYEESVRRITNRRVCSAEDCTDNYHLEFNPPADFTDDGEEPYHCDSCGSELQQRDDDTEEELETRIGWQKEGWDEVEAHYSDGHVPIERVDADQAIASVYVDIVDAIQDHVET